ncbi:MAG TPA: rhodanese-like domain-containing protein [Candidatus Nanoarchaeia archaeon]|nr:rhodanese-like domain-containing protein [Candidatus Nanoarchaeia archaeon]
MKFITPSELMKEKNRFLIVDIRSPQAFESTGIKGSVNIDVYDDIHDGNLELVSQKLKKLPKGKTIVTVCNAGRTAVYASMELEKMGYESIVLEDGIGGWNSLNEK